MLNETKLWLKYSEDDLRSAIKIEIPHVSVFYSQQAIEKALKALNIEKFKILEKTHDLNYLAKRFNLPLELNMKLYEITKAYIYTRYPGTSETIPSEKYTNKDKEEFISIAKKILEFVKENLNKNIIRENIINYETNILIDFKEKLSKKIILKKLILFGSRAKGTNRNDSDYDLIIISNSFKKINFENRTDIIQTLWDYDFPSDIICLTLEEMENKKNEISIIGIGLREGKEI